MTPSYARGARWNPSASLSPKTLLSFLRAFWMPLDRVASLLSTALSGGLRLFRDIVVVLMRGVGLVCRVRVILALVVFLSGAFGPPVYPYFFGSLTPTQPDRQALPWVTPWRT